MVDSQGVEYCLARLFIELLEKSLTSRHLLGEEGFGGQFRPLLLRGGKLLIDPILPGSPERIRDFKSDRADPVEMRIACQPDEHAGEAGHPSSGDAVEDEQWFGFRIEQIEAFERLLVDAALRFNDRG